jgi:MoaA/NifB/PqqE/SkfB family radical SAM enzyme
MNLKYDVEADWVLLTTCNFRCAYCFVPLPDLEAKLTTYGTNARWAEGFDATEKSWLLHMSGGEPSIYPGFVDLCERLTRNHYLSINSNLSHRCIEAFAESINPERVHFINAAVHYDERQKQTSLDVFIARVQKLRMHRFHVLVSLVMTPLLVRNFPEISRYFESHGLSLIPKVMRDRYQGKIYPNAYSTHQKSLIVEHLAKARQKYATVIAAMGEPATINMFADDHLLNSTTIYRGKLCGSGYNFARVEPDGAVVRCGSGIPLGNILLKNVRLLGAPKPCDSVYCPYFCEKYTSAQFVPAQKTKRDVDDGFFLTLKAWRDSQRRQQDR